jgi:transposase
MSWEVSIKIRGLLPCFLDEGSQLMRASRLALVTVMQYMEGLSDRQAAEAVRERIDRKYALNLELADPGFDFSVLTEFRTRLLAGGAETQLLQALLELCKSRGWRNRTRTLTHRLDACPDGV